MLLALILAVQVAGPPAADSPSLLYADRFGVSPLATPDTVPRRRARAIEYSESYNVRLKIHKYASYATIPLFAAEYLTGDHLFKAAESGTREPGGLAKSLHAPIALSIGGLFAVNSVTGVWNLWEGRQEPKGRARRIIHSVLMLASDAGFLLTAMSAPGDDGNEGGIGGAGGDGRNRHRSRAIVSGSTALVGYLMMLVWKD